MKPITGIAISTLTTAGIAAVAVMFNRGEVEREKRLRALAEDKLWRIYGIAAKHDTPLSHEIRDVFYDGRQHVEALKGFDGGGL